jgi:hypothetical protein
VFAQVGSPDFETAAQCDAIIATPVRLLDGRWMQQNRAFGCEAGFEPAAFG